jgi:uncharacterized membrane protein YGL010W
VPGIDKWLDDYGESHQNPVNKAFHWVCVPAIVFSLIGLLWALPVPVVFTETSPILNWGTVFLMASIVYYFILSATLAIGMVVISAGVIYALSALDALSAPLWQISVAIFVVAWIGQFIGHMVEGKRPSFFEDLQFLMIGPIWLLSFVYRRLGIPY